MRPPRTLIGVLQKDSQALLEITEDFCKRRNKVKLISFYELELTSIGPFLRKLIVKQQSALLNVPHEIAIPQFADHRNIVRFTSLQDRTFRPVLRRLQKLAQDFQGGSTAQSTSGQELVLAIPFDITTLPCPSFCGRDDVLEIMKTFFYGNPSESPTRRTFALCGLGGLGKTQAALHYVLQTRSQYKTGVAFMNVASVASLEADFDRLHNLLRLGESKNKINSVRSWLSRAENSQWLLVFDNVDDLSSVPIRKYLPAVNWGHVIFTTRDQGIIGEIAQEGHVLQPLTTEDAAQLLLERSGVRHATDNEMEEARDIADLLGSLPLALKRWGIDGEVTEVRAEDEGVDECLTKIIQADFEFDNSVEKLLSFSLIPCNQESNGLRNFSIHPLVQYCAVHRLPPSDTSFRHELASTLLAASRFSDAKWKVEAISRTKKLLENDRDPYLSSWLAYRDSSVMRMSGMPRESEYALQTFLRDVALSSPEELDISRRFNAQRGELIISFCENLIRQGELNEAKAELMEWMPLGREASTLETITLRARDTTLGKILRYQGLFREAFGLLEGVLRDSLLDDYFEGTGWYHVLLSGVADLYCELGQPDDAEKLLQQELNPMRENRTQNSPTGRRLQVSLAETYLQRSIFHIWVSLARISHRKSEWVEAISCWRHALRVLDRIKLNAGFNAGLVRCSIAHALMMTGEVGSKDLLQEGRANIASEPRVFWIPLFNSQWHDLIFDLLKKAGVD
ncbi:hypothetical protein N7534_012042 [Penicillium rubens]|nr:hypothetical protein N7534_012042 [Penicillium rubens]